MMRPNVDNMASKGLRAISYQVTRKVEAGYNPSNTIKTLIGYIVCWAKFLFIVFIYIAIFTFCFLS